MTTIRYWNAVYTRANCEKKVSRLLEKKGVMHYWPQNQVLVNNDEQKKFVATALFPSIVFVQLADNIPLSSLKKLSHISNLVYWQHQPAVFPDAEISSLRNFMEAHETVQVVKTGLKAGVQEPASPQYASADNYYTIHLPSVGYSLTAKAELVTTVKLVRKNAPGRVTDSLAFLLGFKNAGNKFE